MPESGTVPPMVTLVELTPGASAPRAVPASAATRTAHARIGFVRMSAHFTTAPSQAQDDGVRGLTMEYELTVTGMLRRAETLFAHKPIVTRLPDRSLHRTTYGQLGRRVRALSSALTQLGLARGDRVATLCWNHHQHLEAYLGVPAAGAVVHTLNLRLHPEEIAWIASHAGDRVLIVDESLVPLAEQVVQHTRIEQVIVVGDQYEQLLTSGDPDAELPDLDEDE